MKTHDNVSASALSPTLSHEKRAAKARAATAEKLAIVEAILQHDDVQAALTAMPHPLDYRSRRIARVLVCANDDKLAALHDFIKKSQKTPADDSPRFSGNWRE